MESVQVNLDNRSYSIYIGQNLSSTDTSINGEIWSRYFHSKRVLVVTNDTIAPLYLNSVVNYLKQTATVDALTLPDGEQYKTLTTLELIVDKLVSDNYGRDCVLVALGGGVIGDMTGFAAACYQRGVNFVQIPTTLLAQVDSSVGGKTAVNHRLGKNMIGAFHQPQVVYIDTQYLQSLPEREFNSGMAEVIKYGIIWDADFFAWLENNVDGLKAKQQDLLMQAIKRCCEIKAEVVAQDETEQGCRALLNLGHTFGHAIEAELGYGAWLHGEAVATGMVLAAQTAEFLGWLSDEQVHRIAHLLQQFSLPITAPSQMTSKAFLTHMQRDKKVLNGRIRLVLPKQIGVAVVTSDVDHHMLTQLLN
ncbi:MAG: 3-dehydroquinate synthase [Parashewanella sp.]